MLWVWSMSHFMPLISWFGALTPKCFRGGKRKSAEALFFKREVPVALSTTEHWASLSPSCSDTSRRFRKRRCTSKSSSKYSVRPQEEVGMPSAIQAPCRFVYQYLEQKLKEFQCLQLHQTDPREALQQGSI